VTVTSIIRKAEEPEASTEFYVRIYADFGPKSPPWPPNKLHFIITRETTAYQQHPKPVTQLDMPQQKEKQRICKKQYSKMQI